VACARFGRFVPPLTPPAAGSRRIAVSQTPVSDAQGGPPGWQPLSRQAHTEITSIESPLLDTSPALGFLRRLAPLWTGLIMLGDRVFGVGARQPYTARFGPIGLLLAVTFVAVRHHSNASMAWTAVLVTGMLPMVSVSARSATYERFVSHTVDFGREWFMADLRPDFAASIALLASIVAHFAWLERPTPGRAVVVGAAFGLAVLMKPTIAPVSLAILGLAGAYTLARRRRTLARNVSQAVVAAGVSLLLLVPWAIAGGLSVAVEHMVVHTTSMRTVWTTLQDDQMLLPRARWYIDYVGARMGPEGWVAASLGLILVILSWGRATSRQLTIDGYCAVGVASIFIAFQPFVT
jgi:hypothetical protein